MSRKAVFTVLVATSIILSACAGPGEPGACFDMMDFKAAYSRYITIQSTSC